MFIARQPILTKSLKVFGYELLFRANSDSKTFGEMDPTKATATILGGLFEIGIKKITDGKRAFVNFDYDFLFSNSIELIDPDSLVIEVLEDVKVDEYLLNRLKYLKKKGYRIALDDFVEDYDSYPIVPIADIIKYDLIATPLDDIQIEVRNALRENKILLAEKVETEEEFLKAKDMGFSLFQGYFLSKPKIIRKTNNKKIMRMQYVRIINELRKREPSYGNLVELFEMDPNLAYRLVGLKSHRTDEELIYSIKEALVYMGLNEIERWINVLMLQNLSTDKPQELIRIALIRSKFGELIAGKSIYRTKKSEILMMCLFSNIDVLTNQSMEEALWEVSLTDYVKKALIYGSGIFKPLRDLIISYEKGNWEEVESIAKEIEIDCEILSQIYLESLMWADMVIN